MLASRSRPIWIVVLLLLSSAPASSNENGIDSFFQSDGAGTCGGGVSGILCHGPASDDVQVTIAGPANLAPGETQAYTIEIEQLAPGGLQIGAGLNVHAYMDQVLTDLDDGVLTEALDNAQITTADGLQFVFTGQLTHVNAPSMGTDGSRGVFAYSFEVTAPDEPGSLELRGAMNSFNDSGDNFGDKWSNTSLVVTVPEPTTTAAAGLASVLALGILGGRRTRRLTGARNRGRGLIRMTDQG